MSLLFEDKGQYTPECVYRTENKSQPHRRALTWARGTLPWPGPFLALLPTKKVIGTEEERAAGCFHARRNEALLVMLNEITQTHRYIPAAVSTSVLTHVSARSFFVPWQGKIWGIVVVPFSFPGPPSLPRTSTLAHTTVFLLLFYLFQNLCSARRMGMALFKDTINNILQTLEKISRSYSLSVIPSFPPKPCQS